MSYKVQCILQHHLSRFDQIERAVRDLRQFSPLAIHVSEEYWQQPSVDIHPEWIITAWGMPGSTPEQDWEKRQGPHIEGPGRLSLAFGARCLFASTVAKWNVAAEHPPLRAAIHKLFFALASYFNSPEFIVCPDDDRTWDNVFEGLNLNSIEEKFKNQQWRRVTQFAELWENPGKRVSFCVEHLVNVRSEDT